MGKDNKKKKTFIQPKKKIQEPKALIVNEDNKYVLGGYFSLGLNNFYKTMLLVFAKTGIKVMSDNGNILYSDEKIGQVLNTLYKSTLSPQPKFEPSEQAWAKYLKLNANQQVTLQKLLFHHFPVLGPIMADEEAYKVIKTKKSNVTDTYSMTLGVTLPECLKVISIIAQGLVDCRNTDVHYHPYNSLDDLARQYHVQSDIVRYLNKALVASRRIDKKRNSIETEKMEFLTGYANVDALNKYLDKWHFYPKYDQMPKRDADGNILYVQATDKLGNPLFDKGGNPKYKQERDRSGKPLYNQDGSPKYEEQKIMVERNDFFYRIGGESTIEKNAETFSTLTGFGLAYFCALFLSKPQAKQMLTDIKLFERSPYPQELNDIIRDMLSIYRLRSPKGKKLEGGDNQVTLALDILNELRKCPKELYDVLSPEGQAFFEDEVRRPNERTPEVVKRFRSMDRFPLLALRYIDETGVFDNIRFQVQLGKLRYKFYPKVCINGDEEIRSLQKEINGYGKLQEVELERKSKYGPLLQVSAEKSVKIEHEDMCLDLLQFEKDRADSQPYITDSKAFYNIHNNRIGLFWKELKYVDSKSSNQVVKPQKGDYLPSLSDVKDGKAPVDMPAPMAMLSVYELPALIFYQYLRGEQKDTANPTVEDIITRKYYSLKRFFQDVSDGTVQPFEKKKLLVEALASGYGLRISEIPDKLQDYLTGKNVNIESKKLKLIQGILATRLRKAIRRRDGYKDDRKKIGDKENRYGKDSYVDVRHGSLARYLSESFLDWQPTEQKGSDKLTGLNFSKLQAELATFDSAEKYASVKDILLKAHLLSGSIAHPFLNNILSRAIRNIEELYLLYLNEEIKYLRKLFAIDSNVKDADIKFDKLRLTNPDYTKMPFIRGEKKWDIRNADYYKQLAKRYLEVDGKRAAMFLPDGIFTDAIVEILRSHYASNNKLQECLKNEELVNNVSYLIKVFFQYQLEDSSQPFYFSSKKVSENEEIPTKFTHFYDLFNILNNEKKRNAYVKVPMTASQIIKRFTDLALDGYNGRIELIGPNRKPMRDANGNIRYKKQIQVEIDERVEAMTFKEKGNHKTLDEAKEAMTRKLRHAVSEVKDNERAIRRYKAQDMVLFLMANKLISDSVATGKVDKLQKFKLENVCHNDFLSQTVNFEIPFAVGSETVLICQEGMSLKNYGEFYRLLSDDRLPSLLEKLVAAKKKDGESVAVDYNSLMGELASYDIHRSRIFNAVHELEKHVVKQKEFKQFLNDPSDKRFYIADDMTRDPKRNNFRELLYLLEKSDEDILSSEAKEFLISIRNAFSHNHYGIDFDKIATPEMMKKSTLMYEADDSDAAEKLTTIATLIAKRMKELQELVCKGLY